MTGTALCRQAAIFRPPPPAVFKEAGPGDPSRPGREDHPDSDTGRGEERRIICRACGTRVAGTADRIPVNGSGSHVFFNPHGLVFEIECFARAGGCAPVGAPSGEFSWFPGRLWQIAVCRNCGEHLGWRFVSGDAPSFWGLIKNKILEASG